MPEPPEHPRTERLSFVPFREPDVDDLAALLADPELTRNVTANGATPEKCRSHARKRIAWHNSAWSDRGYGVWALRVHDPEIAPPDRVIGWCGFTEPDIEGEDPEILYGLAAECRGLGLATEAARAALAWFFGHGGDAGAAAVVSTRLNPASVRVVEKLGFARSGVMAFRDFLPDAELAAEVLDYELWRLREGPGADLGQVAFQTAFRAGQLVAVSGADPRAVERELTQAASGRQAVLSDRDGDLSAKVRAAFREGRGNATMDTFHLSRAEWTRRAER